MADDHADAYWQPDALLEPGDRVGSLAAIAAPGHTPGHVGFLDTRDRTLIAGDVFTTLATWDKELNLKSARTLPAIERVHRALA